MALLALAAALMTSPDVRGFEGTAARILAKAHDVRGLKRVDQALDRGRPVRIVYGYSATWQPDASGTVEIEFTRPATSRRREYFPWQRFHTSESTVGPGAFQRWFRDDQATRDASTREAEQNGRPVALADWIVQLHEVPAWAAVSMEMPDTSQTRENVVIVLSSPIWRAELRFNRATGLLARMTETPPAGAGSPGEPFAGGDERSVHQITELGDYRAERGVLFPGTMSRRFRGGPASVRGQGFDAVLRRVEF